MRPAPTVFVSETEQSDALVAQLCRHGFEAGRASRVTFTVLDTIDGRLHVNGLRLVATQAAALTLTLSGPAISSGSVVVETLPTRAHDLPTGPWRDAVEAVGGTRLLLAQATIVGVRTVLTLCSGAGDLRSSVTIDAKLRLSGRRRAVASMVTVHRVAGRGKARRRVESLCLEAGLAEHGDVLGDVLDQAGVDLTGVSRSPGDLDGTTVAIAGFRSVLADLFVAVEGYWRAAAQSSDPAIVHGLRVATRRSRSVVTEGRTVLPRQTVANATAGLGALGSSTGPARDLDVYLAEWDGYVAPLSTEVVAALKPVRLLLEARRMDAYNTLTEGLTSPAVGDFMRDWGKWLRKPVAVRSLAHSVDSGRSLVEVVGERIEAAHATVLEHGRLITDSSPAPQLHDLRRDAKRLRYLLECFSGVLPTKATKQFVRRLKALQDNLGAHQDTDVHAAQLAALLEGGAWDQIPADAVAGAQTLVRHLQLQTATARAEFSTRFAEYDSPATQRAVLRILAPE